MMERYRGRERDYESDRDRDRGRHRDRRRDRSSSPNWKRSRDRDYYREAGNNRGVRDRDNSGRRSRDRDDRDGRPGGYKRFRGENYRGGQEGGKGICFAFQKGNCFRGESCRFAHIKSSEDSTENRGDERKSDDHDDKDEYEHGVGDRKQSDSRYHNQPISYAKWVEINRRNLENSKNKPEDDYKIYIEQWVKQLEARFYAKHENEEWFQDRYSFDGLMKHRIKRQEYVKNSVKKIFTDIEAIESEQDEGKLNTLKKEFQNNFPDLDCPAGLLRYIATNKKRLGGLNEVVDTFEPVGVEFDAAKVAYFPSVPAVFSSDDVSAAIKGALKGDDDADAQFELYFNDPCSMKGFRDNQKFDRCAWVIFNRTSDAGRLNSMGSLEIKLPEGYQEAGHNSNRYNSDDNARNDQANTLVVKVVRQRRFPNRTIHMEASEPDRIDFDCDQALKLARLLDNQENINGERSGIDHFLSNGFIVSYMKDAEKDGKNPTTHSVMLNEEAESQANKVLKQHAIVKRKLDLILGYLRKVHLVCYYSHTQFKDKGDFLHGALLPKLRNPLNLNELRKKLVARTEAETSVSNNKEGGESEVPEKDETKEAKVVEKQWKSKLLNFIDEGISNIMERLSPEAVQKRREQREKDSERAQELKEKAVTAFCEAETKEESKDRFRCMLPPYKLFRAKKFVVKHIRTKHPERIKKVEDEAIQALNREIFERDDMKPLHGVEHWLNLGMAQESPEEPRVGHGAGLVIPGRSLPPGVMSPPRGPPGPGNFGRGPPHPLETPMHPHPRGMFAPEDNFGLVPPRGRPMGPPRGPPGGPIRGPPGPPRGPPPGPQDRYIPGPMFPRGPPTRMQPPRNPPHPQGSFIRPYNDPDAAPASEKPTEIKYRTVVDYSDL